METRGEIPVNLRSLRGAGVVFRRYLQPTKVHLVALALETVPNGLFLATVVLQKGQSYLAEQQLDHADQRGLSPSHRQRNNVLQGLSAMHESKLLQAFIGITKLHHTTNRFIACIS